MVEMTIEELIEFERGCSSGLGPISIYEGISVMRKYEDGADIGDWCEDYLYGPYAPTLIAGGLTYWSAEKIFSFGWSLDNQRRFVFQLS